jgi:hypothetical protein
MAKQTVEESLILDALECARRGALADGIRFSLRFRQGQRELATLIGSVTDGWLDLCFVRAGDPTTELHDQVEILRSLTSFGAERVWFGCLACGRQVRKLYLPPGALHFQCRTCHDLSYRSRQTRGYSTVDYTKRRERLQLLAEHLRREAAARRQRAAQSVPDFPPDRLSQDHTCGQPDGASPLKRPRGRPKKKRPYQRKKPFLSSQRQSQSEILCLRCREFREPEDAHLATIPPGRAATRGTCPVCGAGLCQIVGGSAGGSDAPPRRIKEKH